MSYKETKKLKISFIAVKKVLCHFCGQLDPFQKDSSPAPTRIKPFKVFPVETGYTAASARGFFWQRGKRLKAFITEHFL